jgi:hypothetical protein
MKTRIALYVLLGFLLVGASFLKRQEAESRYKEACFPYSDVRFWATDTEGRAVCSADENVWWPARSDGMCYAVDNPRVHGR